MIAFRGSNLLASSAYQQPATGSCCICDRLHGSADLPKYRPGRHPMLARCLSMMLRPSWLLTYVFNPALMS